MAADLAGDRRGDVGRFGGLVGHALPGAVALESAADGAQSVRLTGQAPLGGDPSGIAVPPGRASVITLAGESGASFLYRSHDGGKT